MAFPTITDSILLSCKTVIIIHATYTSACNDVQLSELFRNLPVQRNRGAVQHAVVFYIRNDCMSEPFEEKFGKQLIERNVSAFGPSLDRYGFLP